MSVRQGGGNDHRNVKDFMRFAVLGTTMMGMVLGSMLIGHWLDGRIGWDGPWMLLLFALLGLVGAMLHLFRETGRRG
jgi:F0F1-type ATP synthase assembly protein I